MSAKTVDSTERESSKGFADVILGCNLLTEIWGREMSRSYPFMVLAVILVWLQTGAAQSNKRPMTSEDLFRFQWISDPQVAPDGHAVAFVVSTVKPDHSGYKSSIYILALTKASVATPEMLVAGDADTSPRWSPDSKEIAFLRSVSNKNSEPHSQAFLKTPGPDEPRQLTNLPQGISSLLWRPDGSAIVVISPTLKLDAPASTKTSDERIITSAVYRDNGSGFREPNTVNQLYLVRKPEDSEGLQPPTQLTFTSFSVGSYTFRPHSSWLFYSSVQVGEPALQAVPLTTLFALDTSAGGRATPLAQLPLEIDTMAVSPDGAHLAMNARQIPMPPAKALVHLETDLIVQDINWIPATPTIRPTVEAPFRNLTSTLGYEVGTGINEDDQGPHGSKPVIPQWNAASSSIYDEGDKEGSSFVVSVDTRDTPSSIRVLTRAKQVVLAFARSETTATDPTTIALVSDPLQVGELYRLSGDGSQTVLTHFNQETLSSLRLEAPIDMAVEATYDPGAINRQPIHAFIQLPVGFTKGKFYPAILSIHGGPAAAVGWGFNQEVQKQAAKGYVVISPNYRGSATYGQQFANAIQDRFPSAAYQDLIDSVDAATAKGYADPRRLGVTGGSAGGLLTDWIVTHTNRFRAAVAQRDFVDQETWWYTTDLGFFHQYWLPSPPFENKELYEKESPLTYINRLETPMLFLFGEEDSRTPPEAGGMAFFRYLKYRHIPTAMIFFPRENHALSATGEPLHRVERLNAISEWFDHFLLGEPEPQFSLGSLDSVSR